MLQRQPRQQHPPILKSAFGIGLGTLLTLGLGVSPTNEMAEAALNSSKRFFIQSAHAQDAPEPTPTDAPERKPRRAPNPTTAQKK